MSAPMVPGSPNIRSKELGKFARQFDRLFDIVTCPPGSNRPSPDGLKVLDAIIHTVGGLPVSVAARLESDQLNDIPREAATSIVMLLQDLTPHEVSEGLKLRVKISEASGGGSDNWGHDAIAKSLASANPPLGSRERAELQKLIAEIGALLRRR